MGKLELKFVQEAFETNWIAPVGPHVNAFEAEFCQTVGSSYAAALSSGTARRTTNHFGLNMTVLILQTHPALDMTEEQFFQFCQINPNYRIERNAQGELLVMSPTGSETGHHNAKLTQQLGNWSDEDGTGIDFDSSAGFKLPNGAERSPDASWVKLEKWQAIPPQQRQRFAPLCPDFVVELRSPSDNLQPLQEKMEEYIQNGAALGWLIDRKNRRVYIYRPQTPVECWQSPETLQGDPLLPGFVLQLAKIW